MSLRWPSSAAPKLHNAPARVRRYFRLQIETSARQVSLNRSRRGGDEGTAGESSSPIYQPPPIQRGQNRFSPGRNIRIRGTRCAHKK